MALPKHGILLVETADQADARESAAENAAENAETTKGEREQEKRVQFHIEASTEGRRRPGPAGDQPIRPVQQHGYRGKRDDPPADPLQRQHSRLERQSGDRKDEERASECNPVGGPDPRTR